MPNPMRAVYDRLGELGFPRKYVRETVLPDWWSDEAATNPAAFAEAVVLLSRHLGFDPNALRAAGGELTSSGDVRCKFKRSKNTSEDDVGIARRLATQVARLAALGVTAKPLRVPSTALDVRRAILDEGQRCVSLEALLGVCWAAGVPVVHVSRFPRGARRMHAMAARVDGRPVIIVAKDSKPTAWLLFIVAHELGHVVLGHLDDDEVILDEVVDHASEDAEESAANAFALQVITGSAGFRVQAQNRWPNAETLAREAERICGERHIDPGHVVLNYAHTMGKDFFPVAQAALKLLEPHANAPQLVRRYMAERLDWSALPEESSEFLARVTGGSAASSS